MTYFCYVKYITFILAIFVASTPLLAQQPSISYLMCDEAKSQLQIHGSFGIDSGSVSIEDTTLGIVSWSDSLIICNLPDSGKGAGGQVVIVNKNGESNRRMLSIFNIAVLHSDWYAGNGSYNPKGFFTWNISWRMDLRNDRKDSIVRF